MIASTNGNTCREGRAAGRPGVTGLLPELAWKANLEINSDAEDQAEGREKRVQRCKQA